MLLNYILYFKTHEKRQKFTTDRGHMPMDKKTNRILDYSGRIDKIQFIGIRNRRRVQARDVADVRAVRWVERPDRCVSSRHTYKSRKRSIISRAENDFRTELVY